MEKDYAALSSELSPQEVRDICQNVTARNKGQEKDLLPFATKNADALRPEDDLKRLLSDFYEQNPFQRDNRRIAFTTDYQRLAGKTQVFTNPVNDHVMRRSVHTERVVQISRTIARALGMNEDLAEAIARGHDIGHAPLGHLGEAFITRAIFDFRKDLIGILGVFKHNIQGFHVIDRIASRRGFNDVGLNLTSQVRHGIVSHDGEAYVGEISPNRNLKPEDLENDIQRYINEVIVASGKIKFGRVKDEDGAVKEYRKKVLSAIKSVVIAPATIEACIVFIVDTLAYLPDDFEDMVRLGLVKRHELFPEIAGKLGTSSSDMMHRLITDVIIHSYGKDKIGYSKEIAEIVQKFKKDFLYPYYFAINSWAYSAARDQRISIPGGDIRRRMNYLFKTYNEALKNTVDHRESSIVSGYLESHAIESYFSAMPDDNVRNARAVVDYIAGFTDKFFYQESQGAYK